MVAGALAGTLIGALVGSTGRDWVEVAPGGWETSGPRLDLALARSHAGSIPALHVSLRMPLPN